MDAAGLIINELNAPFWAAAAEGRLVVPHCVVLNRPFWPPSPSSPFVTVGEVAWRAIDPVGTLNSLVRFHRGFQKPFADRLPYAVGLVALADGALRLQAHLPNPDALSVGDQVRFGFGRLFGSATALPVLFPA